jgi:hypothetical protein
MRGEYLFVFLFFATGLAAQPSGPEKTTEPAELSRDRNLIGREVTVEDRIRNFQPNQATRSSQLDQLYLKRTNVIFRLPPSLQPSRVPKEPAVRITGLLVEENGKLFVDVSSLDLLPPDLEYARGQLKRLAKEDLKAKSELLAWGSRRARDFKDDELKKFMNELERDVFLLEAQSNSSVTRKLQLARLAREKQMGETIENGIAHQAFREQLANSKTKDELEKIAAEVSAFLPQASEVKTSLGGLHPRMKTNLATEYMKAPKEFRDSYDRELLLDIIEKNVLLQSKSGPTNPLDLAILAKAKAPERTALQNELLERGVATLETSLKSLQFKDLESAMKTVKGFGRDELARTLGLKWLDERRRLLHSSDIDGHLWLAEQYQQVLNDRKTSAEILKDAIKTDPQSKTVTEALRKLGLRKSAQSNEWYDPKESEKGSQPNSSQQNDLGTRQNGSLRGMTDTQIKNLLGPNPDRVSRIATQDETVEQWTYLGAKGRIIVNFRLPRGNSRTPPEVISNYSLPK